MSNHSRPAFGAAYPPPVAPDATFPPVPAADPGDPHRVFRSHLEKGDLGKSSGSCKLSLMIRPHRRAMMQECWCASYEEARCLLLVAANTEVATFREQWTRVSYEDRLGKPRTTLVDMHVVMRDGTETLVSVKYAEKARRLSYLDEVDHIARQCVPDVADRFVVVSRRSFHPAIRRNADVIHMARRGWDPEADARVEAAADDLGKPFRLLDLVAHAGIGNRGHRAAIRLIGDGDIRTNPLDPIADDTLCERMAA